MSGMDMGGGGGGGDTSALEAEIDAIQAEQLTQDAAIDGKLDQATGDARYGLVVRWNDVTDSWPARPVGATWGVTFLSTNDPTATAPADANLVDGDVWIRHPDAV